MKFVKFLSKLNTVILSSYDWKGKGEEKINYIEYWGSTLTVDTF